VLKALLSSNQPTNLGGVHESVCGKVCEVVHHVALTDWQGVDGKYIQVLPLTDRCAPREFRIAPSIGMHFIVTCLVCFCNNIFFVSNYKVFLCSKSALKL